MASNAISTMQGAEAPPAPPEAPRAMGTVSGFLSQPAVQKSIPLIFGLALLGAVALAWSILSAPPQRVLFSNLAEADKAAVVEALNQAGIQSELDPGSGTLTVGEDDFYKARMLLASQDLPKASPGGYAILDELPMGVSRAVEGERLRQARETELARSIAEIDAVTEARVHLAMPENSVFVRDNAAPSASVIVRLAPGRTLGDAQVRSIVNLVASSVPGMKSEAVTIVDQTGALLTKAGEGDSSAAMGDARIDFQRRVEGKYREQLTQLLTPLLGAGNFSAEVQAEVDLDETQATREAYDRAGALRSEQGAWTTNGNAPPAAAGIPGTLSNTPPPATQVRAGEAAAAQPAVTVPEGGVPDSAKQSEQYARAYELGKEVSVTRETPGQVRRLSVAVVIREVEGAKPKSPQEIEQLTNLVRTAVGFDASRNDQVTVISRKFASGKEAGEEGPAWYDAGWVAPATRHLTALVIALLVIFLGIRPLVSALLKKRNDGGAVGLLTGGSIQPMRDPVSFEMLDSAQSYDAKVALVRDFTRDNPARAALAVRDMIRTDGGR